MKQEVPGKIERISGLYQRALSQVLSIETRKKEVAAEILMYKDDKRWALIQSFFELDLQKHMLLEQAAIIVLSNRAEDLVKELERLYQHSNGPDLISKIIKEVEHAEQFVKVVERGRKHKDWLSFNERRAMQEILKYVLEQAREYIKL